MRLLFCSEPFNAREVDAAFAVEHAAALAAGLPTALVSYEALVDDRDADAAVRRVAPGDTVRGEPELAVYRGWMLRTEAYARLYAALAARGLRLINTPAAYQHCHELPSSYAVIQAHTPLTVWLPLDRDTSLDAIMEALRPFGDRPMILKDYVKSRKHEWHDACFIPDPSNRATVARVVERFRELQGEDLAGGLVFRAFEAFVPLATHSRSGMPLTREYRLFFLDGQLLLAAEYWEEGDYHGVVPPGDLFDEVANRVRSRFFTMDVAQVLDVANRKGGAWRIIELGDGQVAGLTPRADPIAFYAVLAGRLTASNGAPGALTQSGGDEPMNG